MFKKLTFVFLAVLLFGGSIAAFAWWDNLSEEANNQELELGYGVRLELDNQTTTGQGILVPAGSFFAADTDNYTTTYVFEYQLTLPDVVEGLDVLIDVTNLQVDGLGLTGAALNALTITIETSAGEFVQNEEASFELVSENTNLRINETLNLSTPITITITITLADHPDSGLGQVEYEAVAGKAITFDIAFEIPEFNLQSAQQ